MRNTFLRLFIFNFSLIHYPLNSNFSQKIAAGTVQPLMSFSVDQEEKRETRGKSEKLLIDQSHSAVGHFDCQRVRFVNR